MIYTNKYGVASEFYDAIVARQKEYSRGDDDYSVTELLQSPRQVHLAQRHHHEMEIDVSELLSSWEGHLIHDAVENPDIKRARCTFLIDGDDVRVTGKADYVDWYGILKDYKTTSAWSFVYGSNMPKWVAQLNMYAYLYNYNRGIEYKTLGVEAYITDWSRTKALQDKTYPQKKQFFIPVDVWSRDDQRDYILGRLATIHHCRNLSDGELPSCTSEEMWENPTTYAVRKEGQKRAVRVFQTQEEATRLIGDDKKLSLEIRPGERVKCERYCAQRKFCNQYQLYKEHTGGPSTDEETNVDTVAEGGST